MKNKLLIFIYSCSLGFGWVNPSFSEPQPSINQQKTSQKISFSSLYKPISPNKIANELFDKGMLNYYGYLYVQAEYDFRQALLYDPQCGMCYWGLALAKKQEAMELGQPFALVGFDDISKADLMVSRQNPFQFDVVQAAMRSFSLNPQASSKQLQIDYINALRALYQKYKNNKEWHEESLALFVDALVYYSHVEDSDMLLDHCSHTPSKDYAQEALHLLTPVLKNKSYPDHPGLLHPYIHLTERHLHDPLAEMVARKLPAFSEGEIAHYTHMPTHIYWRRGMYDKAIQSNLNAILIDKAYFKHNGAGLNSYYYEYHYLHSYHFLAALGILTNNFALASSNARAVKNLMDVNRIAQLKDYRDILFSLEHIVLARFNHWNEVLKLETPLQSDELAILLINFTQSLAYLHLGNEVESKKITEKIKSKTYSRKKMIEFQTLVLSYLEASQLQRKGAPLQEITAVFLKHGVDHIEKNLAVMNPPIWFFPYQLLLSDVAAARGDLASAKKHYHLFEQQYPKSTLRHF
jgi:hypothetical protein